LVHSFFSLLQRALPIDAPNHPALLGDAGQTEKKICEIKFGNYARSKFVPSCKVHCCVNILAQEYPSLALEFINKIQNGGEQIAAFCLFLGTSPKNCGLLGGNGNTLKLKTTAKLKDKRHRSPLSEAYTECRPPSRPPLVLITDYL
jgi:hypothetical protein